MKHPVYMSRRPGSVEQLPGQNHWRVTISGRTYEAIYDNDPTTFPLDRWTITNNREKVAAWDSRISYDVQQAIRLSPYRIQS